MGFDEIGSAVSKRDLKIYWLVDVSYSMSGEKIATVNRAIKACIGPLKDASYDNPEAKMCVRAMKFSVGAIWHTIETPIEDFVWYDLETNGYTDTGAALKLMADELTMEKMGNRALPPVIILLSDGEATDDYEAGLSKLLSQRWGQKSVRIAIAIGNDANIKELAKFCSNPLENPPLVADKASDLVKYIKWASIEVSKSVSHSIIGDNSNSNVKLPPIPDNQVMIGSADDSEDEIF
ncbi:MAG: VWA domain-containing protein [Defluviitaleaceae bacterium]|nr:VWA domain-containing protein [Defluviitaleaceae bacterium]